MMHRPFWLAFLLAPTILVAQARTTLVASVARLGSGEPIRDAEVVIVDLQRLARTNWLGQAVLPNIPTGKHRVRVRKPGLVAAEVDLDFQGDSVGPVFFLDAVPAMLDTVRVEAIPIPPRLREFEARHQLGLGRFLTSAQLEKEGNRDFPVVAVTHFPGLQIRPDIEGKDHLVSTRGPCGSSSSNTQLGRANQSGGGMHGRGGDQGGQGGQGGGFGSCTGDTTCPVLVFLDGMRLGQEDVDLDFIRTWDLGGVEFYSGASVPVRYRISGSGCGVLLLWSR